MRVFAYRTKLIAEDFTVIAAAWPRQASQSDVDSRLHSTATSTAARIIRIWE
ncbi:hypothetical protein [Stenotrophomonas sp. S4]